MNLISRRAMLQVSGASLGVPFFGMFSDKVVAETVSSGAQTASNSSRVAYSADLCAYASDGVVKSVAKLHQKTMRRSDWTSIAGVLALFGRHLDESGVSDAFIKNLSTTESPAISSPMSWTVDRATVEDVQRYDPTFTADSIPTIHATSEDIKSGFNHLATVGLSGLLFAYSDYARQYGRTMPSRPVGEASLTGNPPRQAPHYEVAVFHPAPSSDKLWSMDSVVGRPRLLRIVAGSCHRPPLTKQQCQDLINEVNDDLAYLGGVLACGSLALATDGLAGLACAAEAGLINRLLAWGAKLGCNAGL